jgi:hypothetical protein
MQDCVVGRLTIAGNSFQCFTLELPWLENQRSISCIPAGEYEAFKRMSPRNGSVVEFANVKDRSNIQIHRGNYTRQIEGCILVGDSVRFLDADSIPDVANSSAMMDRLLALLPNKFKVVVL